MDIYEYLKLDHQKVAKLFDLYETAISKRNKLEIFEMIKKELLVHADSEAETFYRALEANRKSEDEALHGEQEHREIKNKLEEISTLKNPDNGMDKKIIELKKLVEHHVSDEEGRIFNIAKKVLTEEQAYILKEQMHAEKERLINSPMMQEEIETTS